MDGAYMKQDVDDPTLFDVVMHLLWGYGFTLASSSMVKVRLDGRKTKDLLTGEEQDLYIEVAAIRAAMLECTPKEHLEKRLEEIQEAADAGAYIIFFLPAKRRARVDEDW